MQVKDVMCTDFKIISPETSLRDAARHMRDCDCGYLPVGENDRLQGAVTDRDIVVRGLANDCDLEMPISEVMTDQVIYCFEDDDIQQAADYMKEKQIRRLIVLNRDKRMTGVVTVGDIARQCQDDRLTGDIETGVARAA